jgi:hypothetical protein
LKGPFRKKVEVMSLEGCSQHLVSLEVLSDNSKTSKLSHSYLITIMFSNFFVSLGPTIVTVAVIGVGALEELETTFPFVWISTVALGAAAATTHEHSTDMTKPRMNTRSIL